MKALITGIGGFVGFYLAKALLSEDAEVFGLDLPGVDFSKIKSFSKKVEIYEVDITSFEQVKLAIKHLKPDEVYHLAARSSVFSSWKESEMTLRTNFFGAFNILEAVREIKDKVSILIVGSAEEYGLVSLENQPITEDRPLMPQTPYGVSKACQEILCREYAIAQGYRIVLLRPFSHTGPGQSARFVCSDFARQIAEIELGKQQPIIKVGNLKPVRDFTDVRDIVRGYILAMRKCLSGEVYNICSGRGYEIREILNMLIQLSPTQIVVNEDQSKMRPIDIPVLIGSYEKLNKACGWKPEIKLEETLKDMLNFWREHLRSAN